MNTQVSTLNWDRSLDRKLVHRHAVSEVLLTDLRRAGSSEFQVGAQWPARHHYFANLEDELDPLLVAETLRQATIAVAHHFFDVSYQRRFVMERLTLDLPIGSPFGRRSCPAEPETTLRRYRNITLVVNVEALRYQRTELRASKTTVTFWCEGNYLGTGTGHLKIVPSLLYDRFRSEAGAVASDTHYASNGAPHGRCGLELEPAETGQEAAWWIYFDARHPVFFDHPVDHLPGMLIIEACRQAIGKLETYAIPRSERGSILVEAVFHGFLELNEPATITCDRFDEEIAGRRAAFRVTQGEKVGATLTWDTAG